METKDIIEKLNKTKAAETLYKMAEDPNKVSENEIETTVNNLIDESLKMED
jgi:hypothetical protein